MLPHHELVQDTERVTPQQIPRPVFRVHLHDISGRGH